MFASFLCAVSPSWEVLMFARALQGIGASVGGIVAQASIRDAFSGAKADRMTSFMTAMFAISPGLAPIVGMVITFYFDWRAIFFSLFLYAGILLALFGLLYLDPLPKSARRAFSFKVLFGAWKKGLSRWRFVGGIIAHMGSFTGAVLYLAGMENLAFNVLHLSEREFVFETLPLMAMSSLGALGAHCLVARYGSKWMTGVGLGLMVLAAVIGIVSLLKASLVGLILCPMCYQIGMAMASPLMMNANMNDFPEHHALGSSLQQTFCTAGFAFGSAMWVPVTHMDDGVYVAVMVASAILACVVWGYGTLLATRATAKA